MLTFKGGIHPPEGKELSEEKALKRLPIPDKVIIPLAQHIGAPAKLIVKIGDQVKTGQKIAEAQGKISANIHSSVTGKVIAVGMFPHPVFGKAQAVVIEKTGDDEWFEYEKYSNYEALDPKKIREIVFEMGIVGMGGATFPTHVKLDPPPWKKTEFVILNGAECEPYLTCDDRLMREESEAIVEGLKILMRATSAQKGYIGIEENKPHAIDAMRKAVANEEDIEVAVVKTKYPQGAEKQLIKATINRDVPNGGLPIDVGVVVQNVGTAFAVYEAVVKGKPLIERAVTVSGEAVNEPSNFIARLGDTYENLIKNAGGLKDSVAKIISGGPMMGFAQAVIENMPVMKGTSGILALPEEKIDRKEEQPCISCSSCVDVCPMKLLPTTMAKFIKNKRYEEAKDINLLACIECGSCAYVCPSHIPLVQYFRVGKAALRKIAAKEKAKEGGK